MKKGLLAAVLVFVVFSFSPSANGQTGVLDVEFGVRGKLVTPYDTGDAGKAIKLQSNRKIIVAGNSGKFPVNGFAVRRYNVNGQVDSTFGTYGITDFAVGDYSNGPTCMAILSDDKILVGGTTASQLNPNDGSDFAILRSTADGRIDSTFGTNGVSIINFTGHFSDQLSDIYLRPNGDILVTGYFSGNASFELAQLKPNGSVDSTFGIHGKLIITEVMTSKPMSSVLLPSGKIICAGNITRGHAGWDNTLGLLCINVNGSIDSSFGVNGVSFDTVNNFVANDAIVQADGKILIAAGHNNSDSALMFVRFDSSGHFDSTFGNNGFTNVFVADTGKYYSSIRTLIIDSAGKIYLAGGLQNNFLLLRLNRNGTLDHSFGKRGIIETSFSPDYDVVTDGVIQPDGKIILTGYLGNMQINTTYYTNTALARYENNARINYNMLYFNAFLDHNLNNIKDSTEPYFRNADAMVVKQLGDTTYLHSTTGFFETEVDKGIYKTYLTSRQLYYIPVPAFHTTSYNTYFKEDTFSIALQPILGIYDIAVSIVPMSPIRPGFPAQYKILCYNKGTETIPTSSFSFVKDSGLIYNNASIIPNTIAGDTLTWSFSNLHPMDTISVVVNLTVKTPPDIQLGDTIHCLASTPVLPTENIIEDNSTSFAQVVRGSYDPNDKTENHGGKITTAQVANGDYLQYTIRFQNTGNDTAFNVYIRDILDNKLDWTTMQVLTSSHNYQMTMTNGSKCVFTFRSINLVDSNKNEPGSHGYIVYRMKAKTDVVLGDVIKNTAAIYFDYNLPVLTNTETTTVVAETYPLHLLSFSARKDGKTNLLQWTTAQEINVEHFDIERSKSGREFSKIGVVKAGLTNYQYTDNSPLPTINYYRLKMVDKDGQFTYSPIRMINNNSDGQMTIYPNPARERVTVTYPANNGIAQLQLTDMSGRILRRTTVEAASVHTSMNIKGLPSGKYNITWSTSLQAYTQALMIE